MQTSEPGPTDAPDRDDTSGRRPGVQIGVIAAVVAAPLLVAAVALSRHHWSPVLDMAMTEFRVRDVGGRHTPLIGLPGRIGNFPDQGSHPGPASFLVLAVIYRLTGSTSWSMEFGSVVINSLAVFGIVAVGFKVGGRRAALVLAAVTLVAVRGYGPSVLTHPWNPYFPLLLWLLVLAAAWATLCGRRWAAVIVVIVGSICAQTHVPYLLLAIAMCALVIGSLVLDVVRSKDDERRTRIKPLVVSLLAGAAMWLLPLVDQLRRDPGNITMLVRHFTSPPEEAIGARAGVEVFLRHLDVFGAGAGLFRHSDSFIQASSRTSGSVLPGLLVLALFAVSAVVARRLHRSDLVRLHVVVAVALAVGLFSSVRIFGKIWYYLTLWAWGTTLLAVAAVIWTACAALVARREAVSPGRPAPRAVLAIPAVIAAVVLTSAVVASARVQVPDTSLSDGLTGVIDPTVKALEAGVGGARGRDGTYVVFWQDSWFIGAQGYGLVNELERRGFHVGVHPTWRVPVTPQRVLRPEQVTAEVHLVTGVFIDEWRAREGYVEVVEFDQRTPDEVARFDVLDAQVLAGLHEAGLDDVAEIVPVNLFGASLDPRLPDDLREMMSEMIVLGEPVAVFIAPPGSSQ